MTQKTKLDVLIEAEILVQKCEEITLLGGHCGPHTSFAFFAARNRQHRLEALFSKRSDPEANLDQLVEDEIGQLFHDINEMAGGVVNGTVVHDDVFCDIGSPVEEIVRLSGILNDLFSLCSTEELFSPLPEDALEEALAARHIALA